MFMVTKQVGKSSSYIKYSLVMCIFYMQIVSKLLHYFPTIIVLMNGKGIYIIIHTILFHVIEFTYSEYFILSIEYICELHNPIQEINHANKNDIHIAINRNKMKLKFLELEKTFLYLVDVPLIAENHCRLKAKQY